MHHITLHVPSDIYSTIEISPDLDTLDMVPLFSRTGGLTPVKDERLEVYSDHHSLNSVDNVRINLIVSAMSFPGEQVLTITGDAYLVCPEGLAESILSNDAEFQRRLEVRKAFMGWVRGFADNHALSPGVVIDIIGEHTAEMIAEAEHRVNSTMVADLAASLGIDPNQVQVIVL